MEIVERKEQKAEAKILPNEEERYFDAIISGKDITEKIETSRGTFTVKFLTVNDEIAVGILIAKRSQYLPTNAINDATRVMLEAVCFLDIAVIDYPDWFKEAKEKNTNFSFGDVPDEELIGELYKRGRLFRDKTQQLLSKKDKRTHKGKADAAAAQEVMGGGIFEGLAG